MRLTETCERLRPGVKQSIMWRGRLYRHQRWYEDNFDLSYDEMLQRRKEGLPTVQHFGHTYINLQDFFDFHSGKIGQPPKRFAWMDEMRQLRREGITADG